MRELYFDSAGTRLFAVENGEGRPIILLHGGLANHMACRAFATPLEARFRLVTPDVRASGRSIDHGPLSWDQLADDAAALVGALGVDRAVIGGVSGGAAVAVRTALRHPDVVDRLIILSPAFGGAEMGLTPFQRMAMDAMDAAGRRAPTEGVEVMLPLFDALPEAIRERAKQLVASYDAGSVAATTAFLATGAQPFERPADLGAIEAKTLLIPGSDATHPLEVADVYRQNVKNCVVVAGGPPTYASHIAAFLDDEIG